MIKTDSARCPHCEDSLGAPSEVDEIEGEKITLYTCKDENCNRSWGRTHS